MATMYIPTEQDVKQWVKDAMQECLAVLQRPATEDEPLLSRKEVSKLLHVSLVTLNDWVKRGLPSHKQRGRVYFLKTEVMGFIKENKIR